MHKIDFPQYARGRDGLKLYPGESVLEHIRRMDGVEIDSECGGQGICGRDVIRLERGAGSLTGLTDAEKHFLKQGRLKHGQRLACQARVADDVQDIYVFIANFGRYTILSDFIQNEVELEPSVFRRDGRVIYSSGEDLGPYEGKILGLVVDGINFSLEELEKQLGKKESINKHIYDVAAVGNSTMRNLFLGEDVHNLGVIPFEAASISAFTKKAAEIGLNIHHEAKVYAPPLIGGHAGSDCLADIIATGLYENTEIGMIIDIGTNGEVVVGNRDKMLTASCAAGGAYEGYQIRCGVGAIEGAITQLKIDNGQVHYSTLGNKRPLGVCGSGVIDLLAELLKNGIMA